MRLCANEAIQRTRESLPVTTGVHYSFADTVLQIAANLARVLFVFQPSLDTNVFETNVLLQLFLTSNFVLVLYCTIIWCNRLHLFFL